MKKLLNLVALFGLLSSVLIAADAAASKSWTDGLSVNGSVGYESEYVYRGVNVTHSVLVTSLEGAYKLYNGNAYAGVLNHTKVGGGPTFTLLNIGNSDPLGSTDNFNETDFYIGYKLPLNGKLSADVGFTYYWFTPTDSIINFRREIYAGVLYNGCYVDPAVYIYYDFDKAATTVELSGRHRFDLSKFGLTKTSLDLGAYLGLVSAKNPNTSQYIGPNAGWKNGYTYYGLSADLVYNFAKKTNASIGVRYSGNNDNMATVDDSFKNATVDREQNLWWGTKFSAGF